MPATNTEFWMEKLSANKLRDKNNYKYLKKMGWHIIIVWECKLNSKKEQPLELICQNIAVRIK
jgi:DNA mismatch endonuclease (patch repair protein)